MNSNHEEWRDVPGFEGYYQVSNLGRVRSGQLQRKPQMLKSVPGRNHYLRVWFCVGGRQVGKYVHRLVTLAFIGPCPERYDVNHKDRNRTNNHISNLEYVTRSENIIHSLDQRGIFGRKRRRLRPPIFRSSRHKALESSDSPLTDETLLEIHTSERTYNEWSQILGVLPHVIIHATTHLNLTLIK